MSKKELVQKCKTLFTVAQKAKVSKNTLLEKNIALKKETTKWGSLQNWWLTNKKLVLVIQHKDLKTYFKKVEKSKEQQSLS